MNLESDSELCYDISYLFKCHNKFNSIQRVGTEVPNQACIGGEL